MDGVSSSSGPGCATPGEQALQQHLGTRERAERFYRRQVLDHLNERMRRFIGRQDMMFVATSGRTGACDSTLRTGPPGFVLVLDDRRLAWPEYRGNGVLASRGNIVENPHVGLLFVDFLEDRIGLHVNGSAAVVDDGDLRRDVAGLPAEPAPGRRPEQWVVAGVHEAYIHCAKFIPRLAPGPPNPRTEPQPKMSGYFVPDRDETPPGAPAPNSAHLLPGTR